jgi:hypothetical protein
MGRGRPPVPRRPRRLSEDVLQRALRAERAAERELESVPDWLWDGGSLPAPVETLADSQYGLLVSERGDLAAAAALREGTHISGLLFPGRREIWVDAGEAARAPVRRRFTVGHELGHWVLHCGPGMKAEGVVHSREAVVRDGAAVEEDHGRPRVPRVLAYPPEELDANQFAAAVLMPRYLVEEEQRWVGDDVRKLAQGFGVSQMAMERRLWFCERTPTPYKLDS